MSPLSHVDTKHTKTTYRKENAKPVRGEEEKKSLNL